MAWDKEKPGQNQLIQTALNSKLDQPEAQSPASRPAQRMALS